MTSRKSRAPNRAVPFDKARPSAPEEDGYDAGFGFKPCQSVAELDPHALDVDFLLRHGAALTLALQASDLPRLAADQFDLQESERVLEGSAQIALRQQVDANGQRSRFLNLTAKVRFTVPCGRCLKPVEGNSHFAGEYLLVNTESEAEQLDLPDEDQDVIAAGQFLRANRLIEDELLMAMPISFQHEECAPVSAAAPERRNPFGALAALKKPD